MICCETKKISVKLKLQVKDVRNGDQKETKK
jgi:hypothetical protein